MVEFESKFNKELVRKLNNKQANRHIWIFLLFAVLICGIGAFLLARKEYGAGSVVCVFGVLFYPALRIASTIAVELKFKKQGLFNKDLAYKYSFGPKTMNVKLEGEDVKKKAEYKYEDLYKVYEDKLAFIIYVNNTQAYYLEKSSITNGTVDELRALLKEKTLKSAYKIK